MITLLTKNELREEEIGNVPFTTNLRACTSTHMSLSKLTRSVETAVDLVAIETNLNFDSESTGVVVGEHSVDFECAFGVDFHVMSDCLRGVVGLEIGVLL